MFSRNRVCSLLFSVFTLSALFSANAQADSEELAVNKVEGDLSVMVLGSGGPIATAAGRASASYLIFVDGKPKILMDAGGGAYQRLAASGTDVRDLDIVLLSHLHIDHMGDLSPIIKTMYFHSRQFHVPNGTFPPGRTAAVRIYGPSANGVTFPPVLAADVDTAQYPATSEFVDGHYDLNMGLERYMNIFTRAISGGIFKYTTTDVSPNWMAYKPQTLIDEDGLVIKAVGVNHGPVPALAFRIEYKGRSIVYSGDTSSRSTTMSGEALPNGGNMVAISEAADLLIYDTALAKDAPPNASFDIFYALHTTPSRIGEVARMAGVRKLVLSHITPQTEPEIPAVQQLIRAQGFEGDMSVARDLKVYNLLEHDDD